MPSRSRKNDGEHDFASPPARLTPNDSGRITFSETCGQDFFFLNGTGYSREGPERLRLLLPTSPLRSRGPLASSCLLASSALGFVGPGYAWWCGRGLDEPGRQGGRERTVRLFFFCRRTACERASVCVQRPPFLRPRRQGSGVVLCRQQLARTFRMNPGSA